jgi:hypothetical protein
MHASEAYLAAVRGVCDELEEGRRLSSKVLPPVEDSAALSEALARACEDPAHPLRAAVEAHGGDALADAVANARLGETMAGELDGRAVACAVAALLLTVYDVEAPQLAALARATPADELAVVTQNTDTYPASADPTANDAVQMALLAHVRGEAGRTTKLASALYRCTAGGEGAPLHELVRTCADFLHECRALMEAPPAPPAPPSATTVDRATSPEPFAFYELAERPFSSSAAPPEPPASEFSFPVSSSFATAFGPSSPLSEMLDEDTALLRALNLSFSS